MTSLIEFPIFEEEAMTILDCTKEDLHRFIHEKVIRSCWMKAPVSKPYFFKSELLNDIKKSQSYWRKKQREQKQHFEDIRQFNLISQSLKKHKTDRQ